MPTMLREGANQMRNAKEQRIEKTRIEFDRCIKKCVTIPEGWFEKLRPYISWFCEISITPKENTASYEQHLEQVNEIEKITGPLLYDRCWLSGVCQLQVQYHVAHTGFDIRFEIAGSDCEVNHAYKQFCSQKS